MDFGLAVAARKTSLCPTKPHYYYQLHYYEYNNNNYDNNYDHDDYYYYSLLHCVSKKRANFEMV